MCMPTCGDWTSARLSDSLPASRQGSMTVRKSLKAAWSASSTTSTSRSLGSTSAGQISRSVAFKLPDFLFSPLCSACRMGAVGSLQVCHPISTVYQKASPGRVACPTVILLTRVQSPVLNHAAPGLVLRVAATAWEVRLRYLLWRRMPALAYLWQKATSGKARRKLAISCSRLERM